MFGFLKKIFEPIVMPLVSIWLIPWLKKKVVVTENDQKRFDLISGLAQEAAEEAVLHFPESTVDELIQTVIQTTASAFPTSSLVVICRAVGAAVRRAYHEYHGPPEVSGF